MQAQQKIDTITPEEYLALERAAEYRSEYHNGEMYAMAGTSRKHNIISLGIAATLHFAFRDKGCSVYHSDLRVRIEKYNRFFYPDVVVACDEQEFMDDELDTLLNPILIIEVLSKSTESFDRGQKFQFYRAIPTLQEYVLVAQDRINVEKFEKNADGLWILSEANELDQCIHLNSVDFKLNLNDIYAEIDFQNT